MRELTFRCWTKAQLAKQQAKEKLFNIANSLKEEQGGADSIIIAIVIIVIVVALGIVFREQIFGWVNSLFDQGNEVIGNDFASTSH